MIVVDCPWELENIGKRTVEIMIEATDTYESESIESALVGYEYAVVKVPMNMIDFNIGLSCIDFICVETQMNIGISMQDFDLTKVDNLRKNTRFEIINNDKDFDTVISMISTGMFSTDRISLDPEFGLKTGCLRYVNWVTSEYRRGNSSLISMIYKGEHIGFMLVKIKDGVIYLLLNGLYKPFQGKGLGLLTPASPFLYVTQEKLDVLSEYTSISSNNIPVVKLYNKLNFHIINQSYVFIKHVLSEK